MMFHRYHRIGIVVFFLFISLLTGFIVSYPGIFATDDLWLHRHSLYILSRYGLYEPIPGTLLLYGPLTSFVLGICSEYIFGFLKDPLLVRHAVVFAILPLTIAYVYFFLRTAGYKTITTALCCVGLLGIIRLGGHALVNVKDFPFAAVFLMVSLWQWNILQRTTSNRSFSHTELICMGIVSIVPYLMRTPMLFHATVLVGIVLYIAIRNPWMQNRIQRSLVVIIPCLTMVMSILISFPTTWDWGIYEAVKESVVFYSDHIDTDFTVQVLGQSFGSSELPVWFPYVWIVIITDPTVLLLACMGTYGHYKSMQGNIHAKLYALHDIKCWTLSWWLLFVVILTFGAVTIIDPVLYTEERQILFLYPPLFLLCFLGLQQFNMRIQTTCLVVATLSVVWNYALWGRYAYIYKNPLLGPYAASSKFMGDYWGICSTEALDQIPRFNTEKPKIHTVYMRIRRTSALAELKRRKSSILLQNKEKYVLKNPTNVEPPYFVIAYDRRNSLRKAEYNDLQKRGGKVLWEKQLPTGDVACFLGVVTSDSV